jgi:gamma-glutamyltranspeptidase/glutathione hydrolase
MALVPWSRTRRAGGRTALAVLVVLVAGCTALTIGRGDDRFPKPARAAIVSEHPLATAAGLAILEQGGNAVDAAVATSLALAVVMPWAGNLGGGGFALWVPHGGGAPRALDFRETAPAALTAQHYFRDGEYVPELSRVGHLAVGVPGSAYGLWALHDELGKLSFGDVAEPAIRLARDGFRVDPWLAYFLNDPGYRELLMSSPAARRTFYPAGRPLAEGDLLVQTALAATIDRLARSGPSGFYEGLVARAIVRDMEASGGLVTLADLESYAPNWHAPVRGWFRGLEVISMPPPSSGGVLLLQVLRLLDGLPLDAKRADAMARHARDGRPDTVGLNELAVHWWIEALRRGFADRAEHLGDPAFHDVPVAELLSPAWIADRRISIGEEAAPDVAPWKLAPVEAAGETTHVSVLDANGNAVSLTTTLNGFFGSGVMVGELGLLLNNEMDDFSVRPGIPNKFGLVGSQANAIEPGKRPLSSMTPTVLRQGGNTVTMVIGSPGGPRIITAVFQVILRTLVYGQSLSDAVAAPRLHQQWKPVWTEFEDGWDPVLRQELERRGHQTRDMEPRRSSVQAILLEPGGEPEAVSDPRRGGAAGVAGVGLTTPSRPPGTTTLGP